MKSTHVAFALVVALVIGRMHAKDAECAPSLRIWKSDVHWRHVRADGNWICTAGAGMPLEVTHSLHSLKDL